MPYNVSQNEIDITMCLRYVLKIIDNMVNIYIKQMNIQNIMPFGPKDKNDLSFLLRANKL